MLTNEPFAIMSSGPPNTLRNSTWNMLPLMWVFGLFVCVIATILRLKVTKRWFLQKLSLKPCMDVLSQTSIKVIDNTVHYSKENIWKCIPACLAFVNVFFGYILTNNIHINCLVLWFTKAIVCCTGKYSCISPADVCYSQHLSYLYHTSISLVPRLLFGPGDVWFYLTQCFTG